MKNHNKIFMLARSKLNSIVNKISEALINNGIIQQLMKTLQQILMDKKLSSIRMIRMYQNDEKSKKRYCKKIIRLKQPKKGIDEIIRQNA